MCENKQFTLNRRKFIKLLSAATFAGMSQHFLRSTKDLLAFGAVGNGRRLVVVYLGGGASLNLFPFDHGVFRDKMAPGNLYPTSTLAIGNGEQFLHPAMTRLHARYLAGQMALVNKIRPAVYSRSHETDTATYLSGLLSGSTSTSSDFGWGARVACQEPSNALASLSFSGMGTWNDGTCNPPLDIDNLGSGEREFRWWNRAHDYFTSVRDNIMATTAPSASPNASFVRSAIDGVGSTLATIQGYDSINPGTFPNTGLANSMADIARIIIGQQSSGLRTATFLTSLGGWDTHSNEVQSLNGLAGTLDGAVGAFLDSMEANGLLNEVTVVFLSEFTRTFSNGSGTDHGAALASAVLGGRINGRLVNSPATPAECAGQYISAYDVDHRSFLKQLVGGALGIDGNVIFPETIASGDTPLGLFRA